MKKVLIFQNKLWDIVAVDKTFPVSPEMVWVDAPDDVTHTTHEFNGVSIVRKTPDPISEPTPAPTKEQLMAQLAALSAQIQALE